MRKWGLVRPGSSAGDFNVRQSNDGGWEGWVILSHHPMIVTLVALAEMPNARQDIAVGLFGRGKRDLDARELEVVHVEPPPE
jgi:hypothetical protein